MMASDLARVAPIRLVIFDVDGVLTDGRIVLDDEGRELKFFDVRDGQGLRLLKGAGLEAAFLTGRRSRVVELRARDLGVSLVWQGVPDKLEVYEALLVERSLTDEQVAFAGDDLVDLPVMRRVGLALAPADAAEEIKAAAHFVSNRAGGRGAVRDMVEYILKGQGRWEEVTAPYHR
ncbi:MAG: HAD hydrolase family protein [Thermodesulfobacteriota bacterium]